MVEYRPLPDSALDRFRQYTHYAFDPTGDRFEPEEAEELPPPAKIGERRGLFDGDDLVSVCVHYTFETSIRDQNFSTGGVSAVATPPEHRRHGHVERMLEASLQEYADRDLHLAALWPFSHSFYRQYGWAMAHRYARQEGPPGALSFARSSDSGTMFEATPEDWKALNDVLQDHGSDYDLQIDRTREWWEKRVFHGWQSDPYVYAWKTDGSVEGYIVYIIEETDDGESLLWVTDIAYSSRRAHRNLLRFLSTHEDHIDRVRIRGPSDSLLLDHLDDPSAFTYEIRPGGMVRLVDVQAALESLSYPDDRDSAVIIGVEDSMLPTNNDTFEIAVTDGTATVTRTEESPDITVPVGTLSQLFVGYRSLSGLRTVADSLQIHSEAAVEALDAMFPERPVYLRETF